MPGNIFWITDDLAAIRRDFLIDDLQAVLAENSIEGAILVQAIPSIEETEWLLDIAEQHDEIKGVIGWVDINHGSEIAEDLQRLLRKSSYLKGIRYMSQGLPESHLVTPQFIQGFGVLGSRGWCMNCWLRTNSWRRLVSLSLLVQR